MNPLKTGALSGEADLDAAAAPILAALRGAAAAAAAPAVVAVLEYLHDHLFDKELDVGVALDKARRLTRGVAETAFRAEMGVTPQVFLQDVRMLLGVSLLIHTKRSLPVIAEYAGFAEASPFIRRFSRWSSISPEEFREAVQGGSAGGPRLIFEILSPLLLHRVSTLAAPARTAERLFDVLSARISELFGCTTSELDVPFEHDMATEVWAEKLAPRPAALAVETCRAFFRGRALTDRLPAEDDDPT